MMQSGDEAKAAEVYIYIYSITSLSLFPDAYVSFPLTFFYSPLMSYISIHRHVIGKSTTSDAFWTMFVAFR